MWTSASNVSTSHNQKSWTLYEMYWHYLSYFKSIVVKLWDTFHIQFILYTCCSHLWLPAQVWPMAGRPGIPRIKCIGRKSNNIAANSGLWILGFKVFVCCFNSNMVMVSVNIKAQYCIVSPPQLTCTSTSNSKFFQSAVSTVWRWRI